MTSHNKSLFRVVFLNQGQIYELYARELTQNHLYGFVEIGDFVFGERSEVVVDPSEEKLKSEFENVTRSYIPMHSVVRIDEVKKEGVSKITKVDDTTSNITPFPYIPPANK